MIERVFPSGAAGEREMLESWLDFHRSTLAMKCDGLSAGQLRQRAAAPSSLTLIGLVRHCAEVERGWFRRVLLGEDVPRLWTGDSREAVFDVDDADTGEAFALWEGECERSRAIVAASETLERMAARPPSGRPVSLRWILNHLIEEYARHNGHADILRERIDGVTGT